MLRKPDVGTPMAGSLSPGLEPGWLSIVQLPGVKLSAAKPGMFVGHAPVEKLLKFSVVAPSVTDDPVTNGAEKYSEIESPGAAFAGRLAPTAPAAISSDTKGILKNFIPLA